MPATPPRRRQSKTYVVQRGDSFSYRWRVPTKWRAYFDDKSVRFIPLKAGTAAEANRIAAVYAEADQAKLDRLERIGPTAAIREQIEAIDSRAAEVVRIMARATYAVPHSPDVTQRNTRALRARIKEASVSLAPQVAELRKALFDAATAALPTLPIETRITIENAGGVAAALETYRTDTAYVRIIEAANDMTAAGHGDEATSEIDLIGEPPEGLSEDDQVAWLGRRALDVRRQAERRLQVQQRDAAEWAAELQEKGRTEAQVSVLQDALVKVGVVAEPAVPVPAPVVQEPLHPDRITAEFERWLGFKKQGHETVRKWRVYVRRFVDIHGDIPVQTVTKRMVVQYVDTIAMLPDSRGLLPALRRGSVQELLEWKDGADEVDLLTAATVRKHLDCIKAFFRWSARRGDDDRVNPAANVDAPVDDRKASDDVGPFSLVDLRNVVATAEKEWTTKDDRYWLMMLAIYTGARREELCQLARNNLFKEGETWFIRIDDADGRQVKTKNSTRVVPLHSDLIERGFLSYVLKKHDATAPGVGPMVRKVLRAKPAPETDLLFSSMSKSNGYYGHKLGAAFHRLLRTKAKITDPRRRWHSFRHNFADACRNGVPEDVRHALMGHAESNRIAGEYGHGVSAATLAMHLEKVKPLG